MKISYNWLKQYVDVDLPAAKLEEILTSIGLEVDSVEKFQTVKGGLEGLVIGEVMQTVKHPNADSLTCTKVDVGTGTLLSIVCGAPNVAAGQKVVVALVDTTLYKGEDSFKIKKAKIRGELSEGMICAEDEIGLGDSHAGIIVLPADTKVGMPAKEYFKVEDDYMLEISITPNRIDNASHLGIARDLAAFLNLRLTVDELKGNDLFTSVVSKPVTYTKPSVEQFKTDNHDNNISVTIENTKACNRYAGVTISGIQVKESPAWLQNYLKTIGQKPINNVVDITNFVLHETGQPLHAFDADMITGKGVIVRTLPQDSSFLTLDNVERKLHTDDLIICNAEEGMCIAGVFGGIKSGITEKTTNVFLESAYFNPVFVRRTSKRHAIQTDSSFRFERGVDPNGIVFALKRAALLIKELAGGSISSEIVDVYPEAIQHFRINLFYSHVDRLIGKQLEHDTIKKILKSLEIEIVEESAEALLIDVPPYRVDVQKEADVVEEILRFYGFNNIEIATDVKSTISYAPKPDSNKLRNIISDYLSSCGFNEAMSNSLTRAAYYQSSETYKPENLVYIANPLSSDLNVMRQTLLFNGLEAVIRNFNYRNFDLKLYEFGNCYFLNSAKKTSDPLDKYSEEAHLSVFITGKKSEINWNSKEQPTNFYFLKSYAENILRRLGYNVKLLNSHELNNEIFEYGIAYKLGNYTIVNFGKLNKNCTKQFDIDKDVFYADFNWDSLLACLPKTAQYVEISKFPEVKRDLALLVDKEITFAQIEAIAYKVEKKLLKHVSIFDVFEDEKLGANKKSYAVSYILQDETKTLNDFAIDKIMQTLINEYEKQLGAKVR